MIVGVVVLAGACHSASAPQEPSTTPAMADPTPIPTATREPLEGHGAATTGGAGGRVVVLGDTSTAIVRQAFSDARSGNVVLRFPPNATVKLTKMLPHLTGPGVTIEGNGATIDGSELAQDVALLDIRTHDVIVRDLRLRNGYDNLRVHGPEAFNVVIDHVSSTGARDDGIAIGYGAHDVTVQYAYLAGNTRGLFSKYEGTRNISLHHSWIQKSWARSPLFSATQGVDMRNVVIEDWTLWGTRFEDGASGNVVASLFTLSPQAVALGGKPDAALRLQKAGAVYTAGNVFGGEAAAGDAGTLTDPQAAPSVRTDDVAVMEGHVRARAGCLPRDNVDRAYMGLTVGWKVTESEPFRVRVQ
jgi:hypothetical protein